MLRVPPRRFIVASGCRLFAHGFRRLLHGDKYADLRFLALNNAAQITQMRDGRLPGLDRDDHLLSLPLGLVVKVQSAVDALVGSLLLLLGTSSDETQRPPLELIRIMVGEPLGIRNGDGLANRLWHVVLAELVDDPALDQRDCEMGDVDTDPAATELLGSGNRGSAPAEGIQDKIPLVAARSNDPFEQSLRLLRRVAESLCALRRNGMYIGPDILHWIA